MPVRVRHHVNPFHLQFLDIAPDRLSAPPGRDPELQIELGCADAQFLFQLARRDPLGSYVGVEIRKAHVEDVNRRAATEGLPNLRAIFAHINLDLPTLFVGHRIRRFFINFPDPWFKRAHHNRRIVNPDLAKTLTSLLVPGGELFFQSDIWELGISAMEVFETTPGLANVGGEWAFQKQNPYPAVSLREERVTEDGNPIWRILYRRVA
ncbi:MAG TPA: tRNA (guanosine(46)-N7)-methyltransferase TrmB [Pseudomonadota bacterium]|jgi:tRNA (guanine-N7-)-methyltransferase|nr:tRNA (guanosine(46)-N7)-methyltransferase TrmB [Pseudomonadota bacterium]HNI58952.1 tRNA (guanosine(46)-N7)-methyltransferase TrmB [Pseudomonadota bacterium]HNK46846.1 tRNA (guanosine(46)-N7)-methyltransferase TrmB [Pseudomonadota bacterium]HNN53208.1 tRNA (guanosine(46)-N7)-methyltransferase TrmB [Pseudomonadota bacterium]